MSATEIVVLIVVLLVVLAVVGFVLAQQKKRQRLRSQFGPEYDRTVESSGKRREAERDLAERAQRREQLDIRPLPEQDRQAFADRWRSTQEDFVDRPSMAVRQADLLVAEVMSRRGYPVGDFDQQARDVSVDHAHVVEEYRAAHHISKLNDHEQATTEQLRQAMVHYRALFNELLGDAHGTDASARTGGGHEPHGDRDRYERGAGGATDADRRTTETADTRYDDRTTDRADGHATDGSSGRTTDRGDGRFDAATDSRTSDRTDSRLDDGVHDRTDGRTVVEGGLVRPDNDHPRDAHPQR